VLVSEREERGQARPCSHPQGRGAMARCGVPIVDRSLLPCALRLRDGRTASVAAGAHDGVGRGAAECTRWGRYHLARTISFVLLGIVTVSLVLREFFLVSTLSERGASAFSVLVDAVLIWVGTVVAFAVWYWEIDGGGSDERTRDAHVSEDFLFPQMDQQDGMRAIGWSPGFLDYHFVSFTTSTTFGPTDTPVLSGRVKILTVIQAVLSLVVVIVLVAWAVGTL
jgi:hypothetical protein